MIKERNSNIELLRILCMFMVILLHFNGRCINHEIWNLAGLLTPRLWVGHGVYSLCVMAVDCFVLISGYFSIKFSVRGVLRLFLQCLAWGLTGYLLYCILAPSPVVLSTLAARIFGFTHNHWWFVNVYLFLMFTAPLLNAATEAMNKKTFQNTLLVFSVAVFYFGFCRNIELADGAQTYLLFMYLYVLGRYIGRFVSAEWIVNNRKKSLLGYILCVVIIYGLGIWNQYSLHLDIYVLRPYTYCCPLVIGAAVCLLLLFLSFDFKSSSINWVAYSVFAAYLLQDGSYFGFKWMYPYLESWMSSQSTLLCYALLLPLSVLFIGAVVCVDKLWNLLLYKPIIKWYDKVESRIINAREK